MKGLAKSVVYGWIIGLFFLSGNGWALSDDFLEANKTQVWAMAQKDEAYIEDSTRIFHQEQVDGYIMQISRRLYGHIQSNLPMVQVRILETADIDAFAFPNGVIYLTTGVLANTENEDQLAAILAHEMIHYVRQHSLTVMRLTFGNGKRSTDLSDHISETGFGTTNYTSEVDLIRLHNEAERQADEEGLCLIEGAGYDPHEMLKLLTHLHVIQHTLNAGSSQDEVQEVFWGLRSGWINGFLKKKADHNCSIASSANASLDYLQRIAPIFLANAQACMRMGFWDQATNDLNFYEKLFPENPQVLYLKGKVEQSRSKGSATEAARYFGRAIEIKHDFTPAYIALGMLNYKAGKLTAARGYFEAGLSLEPDIQDNAYIRQYLKRCQ